MSSASLHVVGFKPPDEKWERMAAVYRSCLDAGVRIPEDVLKFFGGEHPDPSGVEVRIAHHYGDDGRAEHPCASAMEHSMGFNIDVSKIPKDVKTLRVYLSF